MGQTRCSSCGEVKFNAYFYNRKDRQAMNQPCRRCAKSKSKEQYATKKNQFRGGEING